MPTKRSIHAIHPGEYIREELEARGWTQETFAQILGRTVTTVNMIINGRRSITAETAHALAAAFDTSAELWMNLDAKYQLAMVSRDDESGIRHRAKAFDYAPVKEMRKRGWIEDWGNDHARLDALIRDFFIVDSLDSESEVYSIAARQSASESELLPSQIAWAYRAIQLSNSVPSKGKYSPSKLRECLPALRELAWKSKGVEFVADELSKIGIRFMVIERLEGTKMDGATIWRSDEEPIVALSMRFGRVDWFWHTLMHELDHVLHDGPTKRVILDCDLTEKSEAWGVDIEIEKRANRNAAEALIPADELTGFVRRTAPHFTREKIIRFANRIRIHPGIVVGQLQHRKQIRYSDFRNLLTDIRPFALDYFLVDGFDRNPLQR